MILSIEYADKATAKIVVDDRFAEGRELLLVARRLREQIPDAVHVAWLTEAGIIDSAAPD